MAHEDGLKKMIYEELKSIHDINKLNMIYFFIKGVKEGIKNEKV